MRSCCNSQAVRRAPCRNGPGFVGEHVDLFAGLDRGANHAERGAVPGGRQRARVAVRQHGLAVRHQRRAVASDRHAQGDVFLAHLLRFFNHAADDCSLGFALQACAQPAHAVDGPKQVYRSRPGSRERAADRLEIGILLDAQRHAHGRGYANGGRSANHHGLDRFGDFLVGAAGHEYLLARQQALIDHDHAVGGPLNCFHHELPL